MEKYESKKNPAFKLLLMMALCLMVALFAMPAAKLSAYWDDDDDDYYSTDDNQGKKWVIEDHIKKLKADKDTYMVDENNYFTVHLSFELNSLPDYERNSRKFAVYFTDQAPDDASGYIFNPYTVIDQYELQYANDIDVGVVAGEGGNDELTFAICEVDSNDSSYLPAAPAKSTRVTVKVVPYKAEPTPTPIPELKHYDITDEVENFKVSESVYNLDNSGKCKIEVTFDLKSLPELIVDRYKDYAVLVREDAKDGYDYGTFNSVRISGSELQLKGNRYTLEFPVYEDKRFLDSKGIEKTEINFLAALAEVNYEYTGYSEIFTPVKYPSITAKFKVVNTYTKSWNAKDMISDVSLGADTYSLGSEQKIQVKFSNKMLTAIDDDDYDKLYFKIVGSDNKAVAQTSIKTYELKLGTNSVTIPCRFSSKGIYNVVVCDGEDGSNIVAGPFEIVVQKAKDSDGNTVDTNDSVSVENMLYTKSQGSGLKITYSISDTSSDYHLFVIKGNPKSYETDKSKALKNTDLMSKLGELPIKLGEKKTLTVNTSFSDFGVYSVILCNVTTKQMVAKAAFYVVPEDDLIQRDISKMSDKGIIPFSCSAKVYNFDLDKDKKITFNVEFPIDYSEYLKNIQSKYGKINNSLSSNYFSGGSNSYGYDYDDDSSYEYDFNNYYSSYDFGDDDDEDSIDYSSYGFDDEDWDDDEYGSTSGKDDAFTKDDYPVNMTVKYVPAGSNKPRVLYKDKLVGVYKTHTVEITAQKLMDAIYATKGSDTAYAGVVTVEFSNDYLSSFDENEDYYDTFDYDDYDDYETIYNEAIVKFAESFSFSVNKANGIKSAKAGAKTVERAYGESASFTVTDALGGNIYADIYKGKKKVATVTGKCELNSDGTASGTVRWDLSKSDGKYAAKGSYKAKIYTKSEYTVYEKDGSQNKKSVKSGTKTVKFKLKNPSGKLSLEASVSGSNGNSVYIESPNVALQFSVSIGSKLSVNVKNSSGTSIYSDTLVAPKGSYSTLLNISGKSIKEGKYKVEVKATTMDGASKSATASFDVKKMPKPAIESASVSADSNTGSGSFSFKVTQPATVKVEVKSGSTVKQTVINQNYSAGTIKSSFSIGGYAAGKYDLVITAKNSGGTVTTTKTFEVKKKPVVVKKPTVSNLNIKFQAGKDGDKVQGTFNYTGKNAKVVIDIMYNDTEEIVYTYEGTTTKDSGSFSYTWDGFKSNGFRAWAGSYTMRVRLINSAGSTDYLRQNFTIGLG